jgi:hypothetical protein
MASRRTIRSTVLIGTGAAALALASAGIAAAAPQWTDTQSHGGATNEVREYWWNYRDATQSMPLHHTEGTWCCQIEVREPDVVARPQTTAG